MERASRQTQLEMDLEDIINKIQKKAGDLSNQIPNLMFYYFGSITKTSKTVNDIDILVIYEHSNNPELVRDAFDSISNLFPIHFIFLTHQEELELNFRKITSATPIKIKKASNKHFHE